MRAARSEYDAPSVRAADASDIGPQRPARYGQNDREIALGRKNHLFAGSDGGAERWATVCSLIASAKLNDVEPFAYLKDILQRMTEGHSMSRLDELLPWNWSKIAVKH
jgi:IS66 C-terminal element